jgi:two-component system, LuxR family, sensor kinase FixL
MVRRSATKKPESRTSKARKKPHNPLYSQVLNCSHAMIRDPAGTINFWAGGLERLYGFTRAEAVGCISHKLLNTAFPSPQRDIDAELFDTGEWNGELAQRKRDGETIVVASHWVLWRDNEDRAQVTEVSNETDERARAYLASIVESSDDAIIGKTLDGIITTWNKSAQEMFGYEAGEICGKSVTLLVPPDRIHEEEAILQRLARGERIDHFESVRLRKDGGEVIVSLTISPIRDQRRKIIGISKIARDITQQRATQNRLVELQSELVHASRLGTMGQMAAAISHELNQPLTAVNNYLSGLAQLLSTTDVPTSIADAVRKAREQNKRAGQVVSGLRDLVLKRETTRRIESINDILEQTLGLALVDAKVRGVKARVLVAPDLKPVLVDKIQIGQVVINIVRNAIEAMEGTSECKLTISAATDPNSDGIEMRIADTGPGLSPLMRDQMFRPFVTTKDKGMGLGLSICRDIVDSHGGSLSAEPNKPNGTIFVIRLPSADNENAV